MDLGEPFKQGMRIEPGEDGTFIVYVDEKPHKGTFGARLGFTTIDDLLIWMAKHGGAVKARVTELSEGDVVDGESLRAAIYSAARAKVDPLNGILGILDPEVKRYAEMGLAMAEDILNSPQGSAGAGRDPLNGIRRTTAAEIIRERELVEQTKRSDAMQAKVGVVETAALDRAVPSRYGAGLPGNLGNHAE